MASFLLTSLVLSVLCLLNINCLPSDYSSEESSEEVSFLLSTSNWTDSFGNVSDGLELHFEEYKANSSGTESENVLILTPYVERGDINIARELAKVEGAPFPKDLLSYSGFFTYNSENAPLILWLQGGPGQSAHIGIFMEIGPFYVNEDLKSLSSNPYSWCKNYSVLFVDNPIGTGFSFTDNDEGYSKNQSQISENLYSFLEQFFTMFPELRGRDFYIAGESYGGVAVASGFTDPKSFISVSDLLFHVGLIGGYVKDQIKIMEENAKRLISDEFYTSAHAQSWAAEKTFRKHSEFQHEFNFVYSEMPKIKEDAKHFTFVQKPEVRKALHVGSVEFLQHYKVYDKLRHDIMKSGRIWLEHILNNGFKVLLFNGQLDVVCAYHLAEDFYNTLNFTSIDNYRTAQRKPWYVDGKLSGYTKSAGNFTEALVLNSGHMVSMDQPEKALDLLNKFIQNKF